MTVTMLVGDVRTILPDLPDESVNCIVTSPPYYGLRDYGVAGQIGLEESLEEYLGTLVGVFREGRRVLRQDGTCWLNIGDSYSQGGKGGNPGGSTKQQRNQGSLSTRGVKRGIEMPRKNLMMVPARLALALQDDGWYLRSDIIWHKPNPMPESVEDRPTSAHEHVLLLTKSARYWYDAEAVRTPAADSSIQRLSQDIDAQQGSDRANGGTKTNGAMKAVARTDKQRGHSRRHDGFNDRWDAMSREEQQATGANLRNVWTVATQPFAGAHFATFPEELVLTCLKAGCPPCGTVLDPFGGSGTTALVADRLGHDAILIELNPEYAQIAEERIRADAPLLVELTRP